VNKSGLTFITFIQTERGYRAEIPIESYINSRDRIELLLHKAENLYTKYIEKMKLQIGKINELKKKQRGTARSYWELGNLILELLDNQNKLSFEIDGLYDHLMRDLCVKRMWLEKVIIFRRYVPKVEMIPRRKNWGEYSDAPRKAGEAIVREFENRGHQNRKPK
jgi:hypothetical protein